MSIDRRPLRPCSCGVVLGDKTCPLCGLEHSWYHMTVDAGSVLGLEHYLSCDRFVQGESTIWTLVKDRTHRVVIVP